MTYGPIDFIALELETGLLKGEGLHALLELVEQEIIGLIDLVVVAKDENGQVQALEMQELDPEIVAALDPLDIEISGLVQVEDIEAIAEQLEENSTAAILLIENLWAIKFSEAVVRSGGRLIEHERIPFEVVNETLEIFAKEEA
jgi:uncharacterized membrane protein